MKNSFSIQDLRVLFRSVSKRRRWQFVLVLVLMLVAAFAEVVSLGFVVPFLAALSDPTKVLEQPFAEAVFKFFNLSQSHDAVRLNLTVTFALAALMSGLLRFLLIYVSSRVNYGVVHELGREVFRRALHQNYAAHLKRNSSEIVGAIAKVDVVAWALTMLSNSITAVVMGIAILLALIWLTPWVSLGVLGGIGSIYVGVTLFTRKKLKSNSAVTNAAYSGRVKAVQEGLGSVRDMILDQSQVLFTERFNRIDYAMRTAQMSNAIIGPSPRFGVEALGMVLIASVAFYLTTKNGSFAETLPILGALALGAQRLMPLIQQVYRGISYLIGNQLVIHDVACLLDTKINENAVDQVKRLPFENQIRLVGVGFNYGADLPPVLKDISFEIQKGTCTGFVGETGSGKSTLIDIIVGLLEPISGEVEIDGVPIRGRAQFGWQKNIAYVPQDIYLRDASFSENIAFGVPQDFIDMAKVKHAAEVAQIDQFIEQSQLQYKGNVGEQGVSLSGGQRQRIGIARAIYKSAPVLVLDEATSALDTETESAVISSILESNPSVTILMIAHRLNTLEKCDSVVRLDAGQIAEITSQ